MVVRGGAAVRPARSLRTRKGPGLDARALTVWLHGGRSLPSRAVATPMLVTSQGAEMAGASKPAKVKLYVNVRSLKPVNSSLHLGLGHVNCAAASSGEIVTYCAGTTSWPFLMAQELPTRTRRRRRCAARQCCRCQDCDKRSRPCPYRQEKVRVCVPDPSDCRAGTADRDRTGGREGGLRAHRLSGTLPVMRTRWRIGEVGDSQGGPSREPDERQCQCCDKS